MYGWEEEVDNFYIKRHHVNYDEYIKLLTLKTFGTLTRRMMGEMGSKVLDMDFTECVSNK